MYRDLKLSDRARVIEMAVRSGITDLNTIEEVYNTFAEGGDLGERNVEDTRKVGEHYLTLEQYKEQQREAIRQAAIQKAITRREGIFPVINGEVGKSCIYTATDNFGRKYRVAGNQTFFANPEKYGFEVNGPVENARPGDLYQLFNNKGVPDHMNMITGEDENHNLLVSYSSGYAGFPSMSKGDYKVNAPMFNKAGYETYRFIGTPDDNAKWQSEWLEGSPVPLVMEMPEVLNNQVEEFRDGGKIHIKPENRGKFTALKERTGHSASWFKAHGTPAQKKMATFALNARKWKHDDGGILLNYFADGGDEDPKKIPFWQRMVQGATMAEAPAVMTASGMEINPDGTITYGNDNEGVNKLRDNIATIGTVGALATFAPPLVSNPGVMRAVDVIGNIDGIRNLVSKNGISKTIRKAREHDTWGAVRSGVGDALDLVGMGDTARLVSKIASPAYRGYHAYNTILPYSYSQPIRRGLDWLESMALERKYSQPKWFDSKSEKQFLWNILGKAGASATDFTKRARRDAWAIYTGQPTRYNIYAKNADGSYSYNLDELRKTYEDNGLFAPLLKNTVDNTYDFIGGAHGFLSHAEPKLKAVAAGENETERLVGSLHIDDLWDLQPFKDKAIGDKLSDMLFLHPELSPRAKHVIGALATSKPVVKLNDAMKRFETGRLLGGKPFFMSTDIPFTAVKPTGLHKYRLTYGYDGAPSVVDIPPFNTGRLTTKL